MQRPSNTSLFSLLPGAIASLLLGGCATDLAPVRTFAEQTQKMSVHFEPMLAGGVHSCMDKAMRKRLILAERFDAQASEQAARADCAAIAQASASVASLNDVLLRYAHTLAALAGDKLPVYREELGELGDALGGLAQPDGGAPLLDAGKLDKVMKLSEHLSRLATQRLQKSVQKSAHVSACGLIPWCTWMADRRIEKSLLCCIRLKACSSTTESIQTMAPSLG